MMITLPFLLALAAPAAPPPEAPAQTFPAQVDVVTVDALVFDRKGEPVPDLHEGDFTVFEDGRRQTISSFEVVRLRDHDQSGWVEMSGVATNSQDRHQPPPRVFAIVWDDVHITPLTHKRLTQAVQQFIRTGLRPGDVVLVAPTSGGSWWSGRVPDDVPDLVAFVGRLQAKRPIPPTGRMTDWEALRLYEYRDKQVGAEVIRRYYTQGLLADYPSGREAAQTLQELDIGEGHPIIRAEAAQVYAAAKERWHLSLAALTRVISALKEFPGRKTVLLASEGFIDDPSADGFKQTLTAAREANAAIYFVDSRDSGLLAQQMATDVSQPTDEQDISSSLNLWRHEGEGAEALAADSGGRSLRNPNDLLGGLRTIADESRVYYLLGYQSTNPRHDGKYRKIKVKVANPDLNVRARKGYYAPTDTAAPVPAGSLDPVVRGALDSPVDEDDLGLRMDSYVLGAGDRGRTHVLVTVDVDPSTVPFAQQKGAWVASLDTYTLVADRDSPENQHQERRLDLNLPPDVRERVNKTWIPFFRDFQLGPGAYQVRVLVREANGSRLGTVRQTVHVPPPDELRITSPVLTDTFEAPRQGAPPRPIPLARRDFRSGSTLLCAVEVLGATSQPGVAPAVTLGYGVRRIGGPDLASVAPMPIPPDESGRLILQIPISLQGVAPGEYQLVMNVHEPSTGRSSELRENFIVRQGTP